MRAIHNAAIVCGLILSASAAAAPCDGFADVDDSNAAYCTAATFVKSRGITLGCTDSSHYCPNDYVTRLQMALFLQRMGKGGPNNTLGPDADGMYTSTISGGDHNTSSGYSNAISGGVYNITSGFYNTVGGGTANTATGDNSSIAGGALNTASGVSSTVGGGEYNTAQGQASFAAGQSAKAVANGEFVWADGTGYTFEPSTAGSPVHGWSNATNTFNVRATGGVWFVTGLLGDGQPATGPYLVPGSGAWAASSDRAVKENFRAIDPRDVLAKVSAMPITSWNYITEGAHSRHLGPVSQDFHSAFLLGSDDKSITSIDESGVALAAIQGLYQIVQEKEAQADVQQQRIAVLEDRLAQVESLHGELSALRSALAELRQDRASVAVAAK